MFIFLHIVFTNNFNLLFFLLCFSYNLIINDLPPLWYCSLFLIFFAIVEVNFLSFHQIHCCVMLSIITNIIYWTILSVRCSKRNHHSGHWARCNEAEDPVKEGRQKQLFPDRGSPDGGPGPAVCCYHSSQSCCTAAGVEGVLSCSTHKLRYWLYRNVHFSFQAVLEEGWDESTAPQPTNTRQADLLVTHTDFHLLVAGRSCHRQKFTCMTKENHRRAKKTEDSWCDSPCASWYSWKIPEESRTKTRINVMKRWKTKEETTLVLCWFSLLVVLIPAATAVHTGGILHFKRQTLEFSHVRGNLQCLKKSWMRRSIRRLVSFGGTYRGIKRLTAMYLLHRLHLNAILTCSKFTSYFECEGLHLKK